MDKFQLIQQRAYQIWAERGHPEGQEAEHWEEAKRDIEAASPAEPDANGPTGAEVPTGSEVPGGAAPTTPGTGGTAQPKGETLKASTELG